MKLQVKTLNQKSLFVDIDETQTIYDLKKELSLYPDIGVKPELQKLIYAGKILENTDQLSAYNIDTKKFVVVMILKQPVPVETSAVSNDKPSTTTPTKVDTAAQPTTDGTATTSTATNSTTPTAAAPAKSENDEIIQNIVAMGYPESEVRRALTASFNNPERAIEYLIEGIPENPMPEQMDDDSEVTPLELLRFDPQFRQLRRAIHQHPEYLDEAIHQLGEANPELITLINENQQQFVAMLLEGSESDESETEEGGSFD